MTGVAWSQIIDHNHRYSHLSRKHKNKSVNVHDKVLSNVQTENPVHNYERRTPLPLIVSPWGIGAP
jgi:hypothetical protein